MAKTDRGTKISGYVPPMCLARLKDIATSRDSTVEALVEWTMQDFSLSYAEEWDMKDLRKDARKTRDYSPLELKLREQQRVRRVQKAKGRA